MAAIEISSDITDEDLEQIDREYQRQIGFIGVEMLNRSEAFERLIDVAAKERKERVGSFFDDDKPSKTYRETPEGGSLIGGDLINALRESTINVRLTNAMTDVLDPMFTHMELMQLAQAETDMAMTRAMTVRLDRIYETLRGRDAFTIDIVDAVVGFRRAFMEHPFLTTLSIIGTATERTLSGLSSVLFGFDRKKSDTDRIVEAVDKLREFIMTGQVNEQRGFFTKLIDRGLVGGLVKGVGSMVLEGQTGIGLEMAQALEDARARGDDRKSTIREDIAGFLFGSDVIKRGRVGGLTRGENDPSEDLIVTIRSNVDRLVQVMRELSSNEVEAIRTFNVNPQITVNGPSTPASILLPSPNNQTFDGVTSLLSIQNELTEHVLKKADEQSRDQSLRDMVVSDENNQLMRTLNDNAAEQMSFNRKNLKVTKSLIDIQRVMSDEVEDNTRFNKKSHNELVRARRLQQLRLLVDVVSGFVNTAMNLVQTIGVGIGGIMGALAGGKVLKSKLLPKTTPTTGLPATSSLMGAGAATGASKVPPNTKGVVDAVVTKATALMATPLIASLVEKGKAVTSSPVFKKLSEIFDKGVMLPIQGVMGYLHKSSELEVRTDLTEDQKSIESAVFGASRMGGVFIGGEAGVKAGAALGTMIAGPAGTVVGGIGGGIVGSIAGATVGDMVGDEIAPFFSELLGDTKIASFVNAWEESMHNAFDPIADIFGDAYDSVTRFIGVNDAASEKVEAGVFDKLTKTVGDTIGRLTGIDLSTVSPIETVNASTTVPITANQPVRFNSPIGDIFDFNKSPSEFDFEKYKQPTFDVETPVSPAFKLEQPIGANVDRFKTPVFEKETPITPVFGAGAFDFMQPPVSFDLKQPQNVLTDIQPRPTEVSDSVTRVVDLVKDLKPQNVKLDVVLPDLPSLEMVRNITTDITSRAKSVAFEEPSFFDKTMSSVFGINTNPSMIDSTLESVIDAFEDVFGGGFSLDSTVSNLTESVTDAFSSITQNLPDINDIIQDVLPSDVSTDVIGISRRQTEQITSAIADSVNSSNSTGEDIIEGLKDMSKSIDKLVEQLMNGSKSSTDIEFPFGLSTSRSDINNITGHD